MGRSYPTKEQIDAAAKVQKQLAWVPDYSSKDEIISALRTLANRLQLRLTRAEKKLKQHGGSK